VTINEINRAFKFCYLYLNIYIWKENPKIVNMQKQFFNFIGIVLLVYGSLQAGAQQITNIKVSQQSNKLYISYNLTAPDEDKFDIKVKASTDGGRSFTIIPESMSGALKSVSPGKNQQIIWDVVRDIELFANDNPLDRSIMVFDLEPVLLCKFNIEMVFIKGGNYQMGSNYSSSDEKPMHEVTLNDFYIGKYEVTQKLWQQVTGYSPSHFEGCPECPVENVSWNDVQVFISKLNQQTKLEYRLPTEAEWEYVARGGLDDTPSTYSGSNTIGDVAWYLTNSSRKTHPVGLKQPNEKGVYDMSGNVWEWCSDWYDRSYYVNCPQNNPQGPSKGTLRVLRGGGWDNKNFYCRVAFRASFDPGVSGNNVGLRLVRSLK
jgi:formylglycine-generating enzyme required for sulfatase activity